MGLLRMPLERLWDRLANDFFTQQEEGSAADVRAFLADFLERLPPHNYVSAKWWKPLTTSDKAAALQEAIPEGLYSREGWVLIDDDGNFLTVDNELSKDDSLAERFVSDEMAEGYRNAIGSIPTFKVQRWRDARGCFKT